MLLLGMALALLLIRHTSKATATYQRDTSRVIIIREIYAVDKEIDSLRNIYSDSISSANTTESILSILRQHDKRDKWAIDWTARMQKEARALYQVSQARFNTDNESGFNNN